MDKDKLQKVKEQVDKALLARGIDPSIRELNDKIQSEVKMKEEQELKQGLVDELFNYIDGKLDVDKNMIYEAIKGIKIEPVINTPEIKVPEIKVPEVIVNYTAPDVIVPEIKVPTPIVNVPAPIVNVDIPKTMEVTGFGSFVKAMFEIIKNQITVKLGGIDRDKPLPVILVDEKGMYYKAISQLIGSGGGGSIMGIMNRAGTIVNPATEDTLEDIKNNQLTGDQLMDLTVAIRTLMQTSAYPPWYDRSINAIRNQVQSGTITTVSTVTNLTNFGTYPADFSNKIQAISAWSNNIRQLIT